MSLASAVNAVRGSERYVLGGFLVILLGLLLLSTRNVAPAPPSTSSTGECPPGSSRLLAAAPASLAAEAAAAAPMQRLTPNAALIATMNEHVHNDDLLLEDGMIQTSFSNKGGLQCVPSPTTSQFKWEAPIGTLKIYVYKEMMKVMEPHKCLQTVTPMWLEEVELPSWVVKSIHYTNNPDEAHMFFIPAMVRCILDFNRTQFHLTSEFTEMVDVLHTKHDYYRRNHGHDHFIINPGGGSMNVISSLLAGELHPVAANDWYSNATKLLSEAARSRAYFSGLDFVIPGSADYIFGKFMDVSQKIEEERPMLFLYLGGTSLGDQRQALGRLRKLVQGDSEQAAFFRDKVLIANKIDDPVPELYSLRIQNFTFCAAPHGTSPWTQRFYDSLISGCIPVQFDRRFRFGFYDHIDWDSIVVRYPTSQLDSFSFLEYLYKLSLDEDFIRERRRQIAAVAHLFYYGESSKALQTTAAALSDPDPVVRREAYHLNAYSMTIRELADRYCTLRMDGHVQ
ncbi:hypothetical protein CAOG_07898 [Capsaspora owczarzaki ATCC 30864]|uniref:Exostosin GT47 domain-containing protein n=1 Tax=Capsaspora owczarzaki (strain ATCC 30864) TaxID=595528 RepID=A0A0D2X5H2_CAPO3|nr:hypothetical protein CAOG_07898 [Capsaspora owczarzaki ATCC 30864]KJE97804.1 hypothetical protein CAOG_007898 [Capsaspora owczarzaki ATCC 30864]|eukprot:XP_004342983.1 hypothetical protein CAOG_07898 [Capsaspora owczarzaki ATCC 30864]